MRPLPTNLRKHRRRPALEGLEARQLLAASPGPEVDLLTASTPDSHAVDVNYQVRGDGVDGVRLTVYRSVDDQPDPSDRPLASIAADGAPGSHQASIAIDGGLGIEPNRPFVIVSADPGGDTAGFRTYSLVVTTHGGLQNTVHDRIPAWQNRLDRMLAAQGFDATLAFNWVGESHHPGQVRRQGLRLADAIRRAVGQFPDGAPVDLQVIGHSQGAIVDSVALAELGRDVPPGLTSGFVKQTMLDPHAANNGFPNKQYSTKSSFMGDVARMLVNDYQSRARDPFPFVAPIVDHAEVYFQHTYYAMAEGTSYDSRYLNLWGQVPVRGPATYIDITGPGISHSGDFSVVDWYKAKVVPSIGDALPYPDGPLLTARLAPGDGQTESRPTLGIWPEARNRMRTDSATPTFEGTATPGADVRLTAAPLGSTAPVTLGRTTADDLGRWSITTPRLANGRYQVVAVGSIAASPEHPRVRSTPRVPMGTLTVDAPGRSGRAGG